MFFIAFYLTTYDLTGVKNSRVTKIFLTFSPPFVFFLSIFFGDKGKHSVV